MNGRNIPSGFQLANDLNTDIPCGIRRPLGLIFPSPLISTWTKTGQIVSLPVMGTAEYSTWHVGREGLACNLQE
jgi:hypothetical protein